MGDVYIYIDETGTPDYKAEGDPHFAIGSATFVGDHRDAMWAGFQLRTSLEARGVARQRGFHAVDDTPRTRQEVFDVIKQYPPRFDVTYLTKENAYPEVKAKGKPYLYRMALFQHLKYLIPEVSRSGDNVYVLVATIALTKNTAQAARMAVIDVCEQLSGRRSITGCMWEARSAWGIQVADYCMWAWQREMKQRPCQWYPDVVKPIQRSCYGPWD